MNSSNIKLRFTHPYSLMLMSYEVPNEKWEEFYDRFGYYMYSDLPDVEKGEAIAWMIIESSKHKESLAKERIIGRCKEIKEELMVYTWNPKRKLGEWLVMNEFNNEFN